MINRKEKVDLGGQLQKIHIRSRDAKNPILLFLHGGPGVCNRHTVMTDHSDLCDVFTVVAWDQRGSGGSYRGTNPRTLTIARLVDDAHELILWLCKEYNQEKIFIIGGSWGSELGTWLAYRYPESIAAYVGFGQVVDSAKNEEISYNFAMKAAKDSGDEKAVAALCKVGPPIDGRYKGGYDGMMTQRRVMMKYGGYSQNKKKRSYFRAMVLPMLLSGEYSISDLYGLIVGHKMVLKTMEKEISQTNFPKTCTEFQVPYYIFDGRLDQNTPAELVEDYFKRIKAPKKDLIWFEQSGHNPMADEPRRFKDLLRVTLLKDKEEE